MQQSKPYIIVDLGGILFTPNWRKYGMTDLAVRYKIDSTALHRTLKINKNAFYTGDMTEYDYWVAVSALSTHSPDPQELASFYRRYVSQDEEVRNILERKISTHTLIACSNTPREWLDYRRKKFKLDKLFSRYESSCSIGMLKPDPRIYKMLIDKYPLQRSVYVDDDIDNIAIAKLYGLRVYHTPIKTQVIKILNEL